MLHESNLLEFVFQGSLHGNERVVVHFITIGEEEGGNDAQAQMVVPDTSCGKSLATVSYIQRQVCDILSWVLLRLNVF